MKQLVSRVFICLSAFTTLFFYLSSSSAQTDGAVRSVPVEAYGKLPQRFEVYRGQTDRRARFVSRGQGFTIFLTETGAVLSLRSESTGAAATTSLKMRLVDANAKARISGVDEQQGKSNYFIGENSKRWITDVPAWSKVRYESVWPGIDLLWYGNQQQLEHDFIVEPGADPQLIRLEFDGQQKIGIGRDGSLILHTGNGELRLLKPVAWQEINGRRREIACNFHLGRSNRVEFQIAKYDHSKRLVIDPVLSYSTFLGGANTDNALGIAVDKDGNAYITGSTVSLDFPGPSVIQPVKGIFSDAFVIKLNPSGLAIVYATWLGGNGSDSGNSIAVDAAGNAYVTGETSSTDFPKTAGALQASSAGAADAFVTKLNPTGSALVYSTYLGGNNTDRSYGIAVDADGNAYLTGQTDSGNFPTLGSTSSRSGSPIFKNATTSGNWAPSSGGLAVASIIGLAIDPANANNLYAISRSNLYRSTDGGNQWSFAGAPPPVDRVPPTIINFAIDPKTPSTIYISTDHGIFKTIDGGQSFEYKSEGTQSIFNYAIAVDPVTPTTLYAGSMDGADKSVNGGQSWTPINNGLNKFPIGDSQPTVRKLVIDPVNPAMVYAGTSHGVYKTVNGGMNWNQVNNSLSGYPPEIQALIIDPTAPATLYAGLFGDWGSVYKTTNGGTNWIQRASGLFVIINGVAKTLTVTALAISPANPNIVYAGTFYGVWKSLDGGLNWNPSNNGLTASLVNAMQADPQGNIYAAINTGLDTFASKLNPAGSALVYSMYIGGAQNDTANDIAVDGSGSVWIVGSTDSTNFPMVNPLQSTHGGFSDVFVTKINATGSGPAFSSYLGGNQPDEGRSIALDADGNAFVTGFTQSPNFPVANALMSSHNGFDDVFVTKIKPDGSGLLFSTYFGAQSNEQAFGIATDAGGNAWITGQTNSNDFPVVNPLSPSLNSPGRDAFIARLNAAGSELIFSTYLGGESGDQGNGIAVDPNGNAYVVGNTLSQNFPVVNPLQQYKGADAFVVKLSINADLAAATSVSAASFTRPLAGESIAAVFGSSLAISTQAASTIPLPLSLGGTTIKVRDSAGVERPAPLFFVSPLQANYQIPPGTAPGGAIVTVTSGAGTVSAGIALIESVAPGLFSANADGQGVAAAVVLRIKADGTQLFEPVFRFDPTQNKYVAVPIDFGAETDQLFLVLFGSGIRNRSSIFNVTARIGGANMEVLYAGAQGGFVGLDQVNLRLPRSLAGRAETDVALTVDNIQANSVKVSFK